MPIYEYECEACGRYLEALQKMSDDPLKKCPECGKDKLKKLISAAGFRLKGGGWYETDFKSGGKKNLHGAGKDGEAKTATTDTPAKTAGTDKASPKKESKTD